MPPRYGQGDIKRINSNNKYNDKKMNNKIKNE